MEKAIVTFEEFDNFIEQAAEVELFNLRTYWPAISDIEKFSQTLPTKKLALFFSWLLEMNEPPENEEEQKSKKMIQQYVYNNLEIIEEELA